jgi:hypothetical protein
VPVSRRIPSSLAGSGLSLNGYKDEDPASPVSASERADMLQDQVSLLRGNLAHLR